LAGNRPLYQGNGIRPEPAIEREPPSNRMLAMAVLTLIRSADAEGVGS